MYADDEQLEQYRSIWLTEKTYKLLKLERARLKEEEEREVSMAKIINNLIIKKYDRIK